MKNASCTCRNRGGLWNKERRWVISVVRGARAKLFGAMALPCHSNRQYLFPPSHKSPVLLPSRVRYALPNWQRVSPTHHPFFATFPRRSNLVNRYCFYPPKLFLLSTCEATLRHPKTTYHHHTNPRSCRISECAPRTSSAMRRNPKHEYRYTPGYIRTLAVRRSQNYSGTIGKVSF